MDTRKIALAALAAASLGVFACGPDNTGEPPPQADVYVWVADQPDKEVLIFDASGTLLATVGGFGMFSKPNAIDVYDKDGSFWVCDFYTNQIRKFTASGAPLFSTPGPDPGWLVLNPTMLSVGQFSGECWVADRGRNRVIRLKADGTVLAKVTGFSFPRCVSVDPGTNDVWVADELHNAVVKISGNASGDVNVATVQIGRYEGLTKPWAVAADPNGNGWAVSRQDGKVVKLQPTGGLLAAVGGFDEPVDVTVDDEAGLVYVVDAGKGILVAVERGITNFGEQDYAEVSAFVVHGLSNPADVFVDKPNGLIYVADMGGARVRVYNRDGAPVEDFGGVTGPAALAVWNKK